MSFLDILLGRKHASLIGLDISSSGVKLVELSQSASGEYIVERFASEAPPRYHYGRNWGLIRNETLLAMLEKRLEERGAYQGEIFIPLCSNH